MALHNGVTTPEYNIPIFVKAADEINTYLTNDKVAAVHCAHGSSRTSFAIVAYLVKYQAMEFDQAVAYITQAQKRRTDSGEKTSDGSKYTFNPEPTVALAVNKSYITQLRNHFSANKNNPTDTSKVLTQTLSTPSGIVRSIGGTAQQQTRASMDLDEPTEKPGSPATVGIEDASGQRPQPAKRPRTSADKLAAAEAHDLTGGKSSKTHSMNLRGSSRK